ncbi:MAG TPA: endonuclease/exonuclease/phosphatase family protein, partial [Actinomycetota bacterium]
MTYNLRGLRHGVEQVAVVIEAERPDVVLVQESGPRRAFGRLARTLGMETATDPISPLRRRIQNAVLVRPPLRISSSRLVRFSRTELWYPRGALASEVRRSGDRFWAVSTHLGLRRHDRRRHAVELEALCRGLGTPFVLGADLNDGPDGAAPARLAEAFADVWARCGFGDGETISSRERALRIDYLFASPDTELERCWVARDSDALVASDHLPVIADLRVPGTNEQSN